MDVNFSVMLFVRSNTVHLEIIEKLVKALSKAYIHSFPKMSCFLIIVGIKKVGNVDKRCIEKRMDGYKLNI